MKYPDTKIESACAIKDVRQALQQPHYDAIHDRLVSTDGSILAALPVVYPGAPGVSGAVPIDAIKHARKTKLRGFDPAIDATDPDVVSVSGATFTRPRDVQFPDYQKVIVDKAVDTPDICIDAALLKRLADALHDRNSKDRRVSLYLARNTDGTVDTRGPIRVEAADPDRLGLIMPCRID